jgi:1-acyl-sn-glycerol-3-phosphate acyltransferase
MWQRTARLVLSLAGWTAVGEIPDEPKALFIAAPHTSNWDGFWALTYKVAIGINIRFFAKHSLFWFPLGSLLRSLGGIPLDRSEARSAVRQAVSMFENEDSFYFGLAPEGTRNRSDGWKTGFYRIAKSAGVPVFLGILDYGNKRVGIAGRLDLTDDVEADLRRCADFYTNIKGRWPEKTTPVRFVDRKGPT